MMFSILCFGLLLQAPDGAHSDAVESLPLTAPTMVIEVPQPGELAHKLLQGPVLDQFWESSVWAALQQLEEFPMAQLGWTTFLAPARGDAELFLNSFAGDGLYGFATGLDDIDSWIVIALGHDGELAQDCLAPALQLTGVKRKELRGESWTVLVDGKVHCSRLGDRFMFASDANLLRHYEESSLADWGLRAQSAAYPNHNSADVRAWLRGEATRPEQMLPEDLGASFLSAEFHQAMVEADWLGLQIYLDDSNLVFDGAVPAAPELLESHAPFFPEVRDVEMPQLEHPIIQAVFARDMAHWWAARSQYMSARGVAETVEVDSTFALLFGRTLDSEVLIHLENDIRLVAAALPESESANLSLEYPAGALGLKIKKDAPEDLGQAFANAFFAAITIVNLDGGGMGESNLVLDILPHEMGRIYAAHYPAPAAGQKSPQRNNISPSLFLRNDGELWISSSIGLLKEIAAAPVALVPARGMWMDFQMPELAKIARRDRQALVANRMLEEGGDLQAAESFVDLVLSSLDLVDGAALRSFLEGDFLHLQLQLNFAP